MAKTMTAQEREVLLYWARELDNWLKQAPQSRKKPSPDFAKWLGEAHIISFRMGEEIRRVKINEGECASPALSEPDAESDPPTTPHSEPPPISTENSGGSPDSTASAQASEPAQAEPPPIQPPSQPELSTANVKEPEEAAENSVSPIDTFRLEEEKRIEVDNEKLTETVAASGHWLRLLRDAPKSIDVAIKDAEKALNDLPAPAEDLPDSIQSRQRSIDVLRKMIGRLGEKSATLPSPGPVSETLPVPSELPSVENESEIEEQLRGFAEQESRVRYAVITDVRRAGENARDTLVKFAETQVLPVVDAVDDGLRYARELPREDGREYIAQLVSTYEQTRRAFSSALKLLNVHEIPVEIGEPVDFERHEPFDYEADPEMEENTVKEVFRAGYLLGSDYMIRPVQVVFVRNREGNE